MARLIEDDTPGTRVTFANAFTGIEDPDGRAVGGTLCDNLASAPSDQRDHLDLPLQDKYKGGTMWGSVQEDDGNGGWKTVSEMEGGKLTQDGDKLRYEPPLEFDADGKQPTSLRYVRLRVQIEKDGHRYTLDAKDCRSVFLARTPVVMVHGINSSPNSWKPLPRCFRNRPWVPLDHSDVEGGNGPVEEAASRLGGEIQKQLGFLRTGQFHPARTYTLDEGDKIPKSFDYSFTTYSGLHLSAKRLDVLAWSYGGVVARWYLASDGQNRSLDWYKRLPGFWDGYDWASEKPKLRNTEKVESLTYGNDVRKLITLGSMWRGVPMSNWVNEVEGVNLRQNPALGDAPSLDPLGVGARYLRDAVYYAGSYLPIRTASMEAMAVDSPWLRWLIYHQRPGESAAQPQPFRSDIAYFAIAGDNNRYFGQPTDPYADISHLDADGWFRYLYLEVRDGTNRGFSDGIVPLWSQQIPGDASATLPYDHSSYPRQGPVRTLILSKLDDPGLQTGDTLNPAWQSSGATVQSQARGNGKRYTWTFDPAFMAPYPQSKVYKQVGGVGRIDAANVWAFDRWRVVGQTGKVAWLWEPALPFTKIEVYQKTIGIDKLLRTILPGSNEANASRYEKDYRSGTSVESYAKIYLTLKSGSQVEREIVIETKPTTVKAQ